MEMIEIFFSPTLLHPIIFSSPLSSSGLCLTFCLSLCKHLLASFLQNTAILNVCSSTFPTIFALSFSVSSLPVKQISLMTIILNTVKWLLSHRSQFFIALLSGTSQFHALPCQIRCRNPDISFFSPTIFSTWKERTFSVMYF